MGFFDFLTGSNIGKASMNALNNNSQILTNLQNSGNNIINSNQQNSVNALNQASGNYQPFINNGQSASNMQANALGLNGVGGVQAAQNAFHTGPGYNFALDQGTQAAMRGASAAGMMNSGNTLTALSQYGQGLANQEYNSWLNNLSGASGQGLNAAMGQGNSLNQLSNTYQNNTNNQLGLESAIAQGRQGINTDAAKVKEQQAQNSNSFFGNLLGSGLSLGSKALTGGLF